jgi:hypothetical protein
MAEFGNKYPDVVVENYIPMSLGGRHGVIHTRPIPGQGFSTTLNVQVPAGLRKYGAGVRFRIRAKLAHHKNGTPYLKSYYNWPYTPLSGADDLDSYPSEASTLADIERLKRTIKNETTRRALIGTPAPRGAQRYPALSGGHLCCHGPELSSYYRCSQTASQPGGRNRSRGRDHKRAVLAGM